MSDSDLLTQEVKARNYQGVIETATSITDFVNYPVSIDGIKHVEAIMEQQNAVNIAKDSFLRMIDEVDKSSQDPVPNNSPFVTLSSIARGVFSTGKIDGYRNLNPILGGILEEGGVIGNWDENFPDVKGIENIQLKSFPTHVEISTDDPELFENLVGRIHLSEHLAEEERDNDGSNRSQVKGFYKVFSGAPPLKLIAYFDGEVEFGSKTISEESIAKHERGHILFDLNTATKGLDEEEQLSEAVVDEIFAHSVQGLSLNLAYQNVIKNTAMSGEDAYCGKISRAMKAIHKGDQIKAGLVREKLERDTRSAVNLLKAKAPNKNHVQNFYPALILSLGPNLHEWGSKLQDLLG